jgi:glycosyltransferase involved in cell wall biosynthesis
MNKKPKILHVTSGTGKAGIENCVIEVTKALGEEFEFGHLGLFGSGRLTEDFSQMDLHSVSADLPRIRHLLYPLYFTHIPRLTKLIENFGADIVVIYLPPFQWFMAKAAKNAGAKVLFEAHLGISYHNPKLGAFVERRGVINCDAAIAVSHYIANHYIKEFGVDRSKIGVVHNGIDVSRFRPASDFERNEIRRELGIPEDSLVIGTISRFAPAKEVQALAKVFANIADKHTNTDLLLVGDGPEMPEVQAELAGIDPRRYYLPGFRRDTERMYRALDIFVMPSAFEAFPLILLEAMASGLACVSTAVGGATEIGKDKEDVLYIQPGDNLAMQRAIEELIADKPFRASMAARARDKAVKCFPVEDMIQKKKRIYKSLLDDK